MGRGRRFLTAVALVGGAAAGAPAQEGGPLERLVVTPRDAIVAPGERLTLEAFGTVRGRTETVRVACTWRLLAQRGQARLAVGRTAGSAVVLEAGAAPAFVVVEARQAGGDGERLIAKTTVLCSRPILTAPARIAVGEAAPVELTLPLLPADRRAFVSVEVLEAAEGGDPRLVRMTDGPLGPVGGTYAVRMPVEGGALQVGLRVQAPGRYVIRGRVRVDDSELLTDPTTVQAMTIAALRVAAYRPGPPADPSELPAGPSGHGVPGPYVIEPPQAVAPVVLGFGAAGEALGILSPATATLGDFVGRGGTERLQPRRLPLGMLFVDARPTPPPAAGAVTRRVVTISVLGAVARHDPTIRAGLTLCAVEPAPVTPLPVGASLRLGIALEGRMDAVTVSALDGRSAYALGEAGRARVAVEPASAVDAVVRGIAPGLAEVRSRCALRDGWGGEGRLRLLTEFLVIADDAVVLCDAGGRPVARPGDAVQAVAGAGAVDPDGLAATLPPGLEPGGAPRRLDRDGGACWVVPVRARRR